MLLSIVNAAVLETPDEGSKGPVGTVLSIPGSMCGAVSHGFALQL